MTSISCRPPGSSRGALQPDAVEFNRSARLPVQCCALARGAAGGRIASVWIATLLQSAWTTPARHRPEERALGDYVVERSLHACPEVALARRHRPRLRRLCPLAGAAGAVLTVMLSPLMKAVYKHLAVF
jgi:hypothetical protein